MHYYQFNIGDYSRRTSRLSLLEDLAYRRLLDLCYLSEQPLNGCSTDVARDVGMAECQPEVDYVLRKFFTEFDGGWVNDRASEEIEFYQSKKKMASKAGKASGKARKLKASEQTFNDRSTNVQPTINQQPITNNHKPLTINKEPVKKKGFIKPSISELITEFSNRVTDPSQQAETFLNYYESNGWKVGKNAMKSWKHAVTNWITRGKGNTTYQQAVRKESRSDRIDREHAEYLKKNGLDGRWTE